MSQHSELVGSFIRVGNFPLEADYIFSSEEELLNFYQDDINKSTLHKGLFKIVSGDVQTLYWVKFNKTSKELELVPLISEDSIENLLNKIQDLKTTCSEINEKLKEVDDLSESEDLLNQILNKIVGTDSEDLLEYLDSVNYNNITDLSEVLTAFLNVKDTTLEDVLDLIKKVKKDLEYDYSNLYRELNQTQIGVGLDSSGLYTPDPSTNYLKESVSVTNSLKILDNLIKELSEKESGSNSPDITKVSELENDVPYATVSEVNSKISNITSLLNNKVNSEDVYTKEEVDSKIQLGSSGYDDTAIRNRLASLEAIDHSNFVTSEQLNNSINEVVNESVNESINSVIENYYTKEEVDNRITEIATGGEIDLSSYETVKGASEKYQPKGNYLTEHLSLADYALKSEIPDPYDDSLLSNRITALENKESEYDDSELKNQINTLLNNITNNYYSKSEVDTKLADAVTGGSIDLSNYYTKQEVNDLINSKDEWYEG